MPVRLRCAAEADRPFLIWLEEACMRDYAIALWGAWRPRPDHASTLDGCRILVESGRDAGCVAIVREPAHLWIDRLYVAPGFQNRGIGTQALLLVISEATSKGLLVKLSVLTTNPALAFYLRHGLRVEDETPDRRYLSTSR